MTTTAYVYDQSTKRCVFKVTGPLECVEFEISAHLEQNGTPSTFDPKEIIEVEESETLEV